jgi:hypothetical protein
MYLVRKLTFYADTSRLTNNRFTWKVNNKADAAAALKRFRGKGWNIRAAWFDKERIL